ncbi:primase-helicase family protein, partial [Streptococcus pneumoniae]|uniref:primase-helicase family protein n=1 Tax=Streptococcus pneumoniae TaxID=1313 RepID=UPI0018B0C7A8
FRVIHHALGNDADCTAHFINWVSFILQKRTRTLTAWVLHGTEGTGKGILMNRILRPIFGKNQTASRRMEEFNEPYNAFMKQCFLVFVDEVDA